MHTAQAKAAANFQDHQPILEEFYVSSRQLRPPKKVLIRRYQESDREAVRWICCETGFLGQPIDAIYRDRELFADLITNPYLDYEPEWALVAESDHQVVGYLLGSVTPHFNRTLMLSGFQTACKMLTRLLTYRYSEHPRSEQFVRWVLTKGLMEQPRHPDGAAHLHLNLEKAYRLGRVALRLWLNYEEMLRWAGLDHYYAEFFSCPQRHPEHVYARYGFTVFDRSETTIFQPEIPDTVSIVCAQKRLDTPVRALRFPMVQAGRPLYAGGAAKMPHA
jgi:hypothetical protein